MSAGCPGCLLLAASRFLLLEPGLKVFLLSIEVRLVALRIDEGIQTALLQSRVLLREAIEGSVRTEEHIDRKRAQNLEASDVIVSDLRLILVVHQHVPRIHADAAKDYHVV
jgi:hypothetical protein